MAVDVGSIIAHLILDRSQFDRSLAEARAEAAAFPDVNVRVAASTGGFDAAMAAAQASKAKVASPVSTPVGMDQGRFDAGVAAVSAMKARMASPVVVPVELDADKLALFSRLVGSGQAAKDVASFLGFNRAELGSALAAMAAAATADQRASFEADGRAVAAAMVAGWLGGLRELGAGGPASSVYRQLGVGAGDSTRGPIPLGPSDPGFTWVRGELGPGDQSGAFLPAVIDAVARDITGGAGGGGDTGPGFFSRLLGGLGLGLLAGGKGAGGWLGANAGTLLWGGGSGGIPTGFGAVGAGLAGLGSIGALAGLGPEHLLMTAAGLAGSAGGGILGAGLLGLGSAGTMGVGLGTDMAGIGQAAGDIKSTYTAMQNLDQAVAMYGAHSAQAAQAQAQLNYTLSSFSPIARGAVQQAATVAGQFRAMFDQVTGPAEKIGAQILTQAMKVGEAFLPTIGKFAAQNMGIIQHDLQPLFSWLGGVGGLSIFTNLEQTFQKDLPVGLDILTNGLELFAKTVDIASTYVGGFLPKLDAFLQKWNSPAGTNAWGVEIGKLIGDFRMWEGLIKAVGQDIYYLFHNDAGTGAAIVTTLTQMLQKLGAWERSTAGSAQLHNIFETHKQEVLQLLALLPPLLSAIGRIELALAPGLTTAFTVVLRDGILPIVTALSKDPIGAWALGLALIAGKLGLLGPLFGRLALEIRAAGAAMGLFDLEADANPIGLLVLAVAALALGLTELVLHFKSVSAFLSGPWGYAVAAAVLPLSPLLSLATLIIGHWRGFETFFVGLWHDVDTAFHDGVATIEGVAGAIAGLVVQMEGPFRTFVPHVLADLAALPGDLDRLGDRALVSMLGGIGAGAAQVWAFFTALPGRVLSDIAALPGDLNRAGDTALVQMGIGVVAGAAGLWVFFAALPGKAVSLIAALPGDLNRAGSAAMVQMLAGITSGAAGIWSFFAGFAARVIAAVGNLAGQLFSEGLNAGRSIVDGITSGISAGAGSVFSAIGGLASSAIGTFKGLLGIKSPSAVFAAAAAAIPQGVAQGILSELTSVDQAMMALIAKLTSFVQTIQSLIGGAGGTIDLTATTTPGLPGATSTTGALLPMTPAAAPTTSTGTAPTDAQVMQTAATAIQNLLWASQGPAAPGAAQAFYQALSPTFGTSLGHSLFALGSGALGDASNPAMLGQLMQQAILELQGGYGFGTTTPVLPNAGGGPAVVTVSAPISLTVQGGSSTAETVAATQAVVQQAVGQLTAAIKKVAGP